MASQNDKPQKGKDQIRRVNNTTIGWAIGGAVLVMLLSLSVFTGRGTPPKSGGNAPNSPTQTQPQR
jgi:hypothetical protein